MHRPSHPDNCWVLLIWEGEATLCTKQGSILIFSTKEKANALNDEHLRNSYMPKEYTWEDFVATYGERYTHAVLDHTGRPGSYTTIPLQSKPVSAAH